MILGIIIDNTAYKVFLHSISGLDSVLKLCIAHHLEITHLQCDSDIAHHVNDILQKEIN